MQKLTKKCNSLWHMAKIANLQQNVKIAEKLLPARLRFSARSNYHFMTSSDQFLDAVRSAVKSNFTVWCDQNLSKHALNALFTVTHQRLNYAGCSNCKQYMRWRNVYVGHNEMYDYDIYNYCPEVLVLVLDGEYWYWCLTEKKDMVILLHHIYYE